MTRAQPRPKRGLGRALISSERIARRVREMGEEISEVLTEARRVGEATQRRMREETEADRQRRIEETRKQIEAETRRSLELIRAEVADLSLIAAEKVTRRSLDDADHKRLIEDAVGELDFSVLEGNDS